MSCPTLRKHEITADAGIPELQLQIRTSRSGSLPSYSGSLDTRPAGITDHLAVQLGSHLSLRSYDMGGFVARNRGVNTRQARTNNMGAFRSQGNSIGGSHNVVDITRIRQGLDVRTTVSNYCTQRRIQLTV